MAVNVYKSSDTSAPSITGALGSVITVLDACLVNGYGSKAAAGWTKPFATTNRGVYRMPAGNQRFVNIDDSLTTISAAATGYNTMSAVATGTERFPTKVSLNQVTGLSDFMFLHKGDDSAGTVREWMVIATDKCFYYIIRVNAAVAIKPSYSVFFFGDYNSHTPGDTNNTMIFSNSGMTSAASTNYTFSSMLSQNPYLVNNVCYCRSAIGLRIPTYGFLDATMGLYSSQKLVNPENNSIVLSPIYCGVQPITSKILLGVLPGVYSITTPNNSLNGGSTRYSFSGPELTGKTFELKDVYAGVSLMFEVSDTW